MQTPITSDSAFRPLHTLDIQLAIRRAAHHRTAWDAGERVWLCDVAYELRIPLLPDLAAALIAASQRGELRLSRCDLPHLAPAGVVAASEIRDSGCEWHMVRVGQ